MEQQHYLVTVPKARIVTSATLAEAIPAGSLTPELVIKELEGYGYFVCLLAKFEVVVVKYFTLKYRVRATGEHAVGLAQRVGSLQQVWEAIYEGEVSQATHVVAGVRVVWEGGATFFSADEVAPPDDFYEELEQRLGEQVIKAQSQLDDAIAERNKARLLLQQRALEAAKP